MQHLKKGDAVIVNADGPPWAVGKRGRVDCVRPHQPGECSQPEEGEPERPATLCVEVVLDEAPTKTVNNRRVKRTYKFTPDCLDLEPPAAAIAAELPAPAPEDLAKAA